MKRALITGITGQIGSYLAELLLEKDYKVYGLIRRTGHHATERIDHILDKLELLEGDMCDKSSIEHVLEKSEPEEIYNLAAQSYVVASFNQPRLTGDVNAFGVLNLLEAALRMCPMARIYQASSSEMFGGITNEQDESTPFYPKSPYACSKVYAHNLCVNYREAYGMHINCGIKFNNESPRRGMEFVTRKIAYEVARIKTGKQGKLFLGNIHAVRDWGYTGDYVDAIWRMLQQEKPGDYVIATGIGNSVIDLCEEAFGCVNLDWREYVEIKQNLVRLTEVNKLVGRPNKILKMLGWSPIVNFHELIGMMVGSEMEKATKQN